MIALRRYAEYKDSGVPWLGRVPEHWEIVPNRAVFDEIKQCGYPDEEMLSVTIDKGIITQANLLEDSSKKDSSNLDKSKYKLIQPGDIAYNKMRAWQGAIGSSPYRGIISPAYVVQRPRACGYSQYWHLLLRTPMFAKEVERWSYGLASDMWSLRPEHFKLIYLCLPPLPEQAAIVRYLDYAEQRVQRAVSAKRKLIELLEELKRGIIHRAVTRGLNPDAPLKDSGVEWLGNVPEHWEVQRIKNTIARCISGVWGSEPDGKSDLPCVRVADFVRDRWRVHSPIPTMRSIEQTDHQTKVLKFGDLLLEKSGGGEQQPVGIVVLFNQHEPAVCSNFIAAMRVHRKHNSRFMIYLHAALYSIRLNIRSIKQTTGIQNLDLSSYLSETVALPPIPEQTAIVEHLDKQTTKIDAAITRARREIELLTEYRTRLIADVVTGQLDVREAAADLPESSADPLNNAEFA